MRTYSPICCLPLPHPTNKTNHNVNQSQQETQKSGKTEYEIRDLRRPGRWRCWITRSWRGISRPHHQVNNDPDDDGQQTKNANLHGRHHYKRKKG